MQSAITHLRTPHRRVRLGDIPDVSHLRAALKAAGCPVGGWADEIFDHSDFILSTDAASVEVAELTPHELGFTVPTSYEDICREALVRGYLMCPAEVGPLLRLQWNDQPANMWVEIAMEPIADSVGTPTIFFLGRGSGGYWLGASRGHPKVKWTPDIRFVFMCT